jgi:UDP-GlcNAc:undecaprenyl-phosphate GlcNAc-1-phosphate transferase
LISAFQYFSLFVSSFLIVTLLTPYLRKIALLTNFVDYPNSAHKSHLKATPYLGGVAILLGVVVTSYVALISQSNLRGNIWTATSLFGPAIILGIVGLVDDRKNLPPLPRFIAQSSVGIFSAIVLISTDTMGNPTGNWFLDAAITVIWIVGVSNSINFFDNLDGGAAGAVAATALGLYLIALDNGQFLISATAITVLASMTGFLIWNKSPAKIYMGDAGALFLGVILSVLTLRLDPMVEGQIYSFAIPLLLLAVPILDTAVAVLSRMRRRVSIFQGGRDHLSHRLLRKGFSKKQSALILWSLSGVYSGVAVVIAMNHSKSIFFLTLSVLLWISLIFVAMRSDDN